MTFRSEDSIGYWLAYAYRCNFYIFSETLRASCREHGKPYVITPAQWGILSVLGEHDGITAGMISQFRKADAPTVTGIVTRLEQSGLVERRHDPADRRVVKVYITAEGSEALAFCSEAAIRLHQTTVQGISESDQQHFLATLEQIIANVIAAGDMSDRFGPPPASPRKI